MSIATEAVNRWAQALSKSDTDFNPDTVTPGLAGFLITFFVAVITVVLIIDMVRRIRRLNYRAQVGAKIDAEIAASDRNDQHTS